MGVKNSVKDFDAAYVAGEKRFSIDYEGEEKIFIAKELGYLAVQNIAIQASQFGLNGAALIVAASIETEDGLKFTYDEILRLKKKVAQVFFDNATAINPMESPEKK